MKRLECLSLLGPLIKDDDLVVTTLGWVAGEWFAVRHKESNLYQVNMGMCTPLCLGLALVLPHRRVVGWTAHGNRWRHRFGRNGQRSRHRELLFGQLAQ